MGTSITRLQSQVFAEMGGTFPGTPNPPPAGSSLVNVELTQEQFNAAIYLGKQWFTARKGFVIFRRVNIICGQNDYYMAEDVQQVLDVVFEVPTDVAAFFSLGFFDLIPYGPQGVGSIGAGLTNYSSFAQLIQFNEQRKRVFSVEPEWWYEQQTKVLHITNRTGALIDFMAVQCTVNDFDPAHLSDKDDWIFGRWVRAKCKEIIGRIRSKYDTLPAAGGPIALDGKDLLAEAKAEYEILDKEIFWSQGPDSVLIG
jgi:hypothetical protein